MLRDIFLHGRAGREFGRHFRLDVASPFEAVRALCTLRPGLRAALRQGAWRMVVGPAHVSNAVPIEFANMRLGSQPLHLVPATQPAGGDVGKTVGTVVAGVALVGAAFAFAPAAAAGAGFLGADLSVGGVLGASFGSMALAGASLVLSGVASLLTSPPKVQANQQATDIAPRPEDRPSFLFNGVTNNSQQGGPVPVVIGLHLVGSVVVSAGLHAEDIA